MLRLDHYQSVSYQEIINVEHFCITFIFTLLFVLIPSSPEVFKLWIGSQTWVALALNLGRRPFRDPKKYKQALLLSTTTSTHFAL